MKTTLIKMTAFIRVPEEWDAGKCNQLRADPNGLLSPTLDDPQRRVPLPPGPLDMAIAEALTGLAEKLAAIDPAIELVHEVKK